MWCRNNIWQSIDLKSMFFFFGYAKGRRWEGGYILAYIFCCCYYFSRWVFLYFLKIESKSFESEGCEEFNDSLVWLSVLNLSKDIVREPSFIRVIKISIRRVRRGLKGLLYFSRKNFESIFLKDKMRGF